MFRSVKILKEHRKSKLKGKEMTKYTGNNIQELTNEEIKIAKQENKY